jgi:VIT1/CCC1 family predicted Fe2+/Mn2+ transporter
MKRDAAPATVEDALDPVDLCSEILFGLIMAVTIVGSIAVGSAGAQEVRTVLAAALGCNLAWGLVDAVMHLVRTATERTRNRTIAAQAQAAPDAAAGQRVIQDALPASIAAITGPEELEGMRRRLLALPAPVRPVLDRHDVAAAVRIFLFVVVATFPVVVPFLLMKDVGRAMQAAQAVTVVMLFVVGWALGRYAGHSHPVRAGVFAAVFGVALIAAVKALGG